MNPVAGKDPSLRDLLRILDRRRKAFFATLIVVFLLAVLACVVMTRRYTAAGVFEVQESSADSLGLDDLMGGSSSGSSVTTPTGVDLELQTEAEILKSNTLALQVIKDLDLRHNKDFEPRFNPIGWLFSLITPKGPVDPVGASIEDSPHLRTSLLTVFSGHLQVKVNSGTRLIEVDFSNRDPRVAAAVVNHLIQALIDYSFQTKFTATNDVSNWLQGQLGDLRKQSEDLQTKVVALQQGSGIFGVGGTDLQGKPVVYSPVLDRLQQMTAQLSAAEMNRIIKGSIYQTVKSGDPEEISQLAGTMMASSSQGVQSSLALIQTLRAQEATLKSQIDQDATQYGPAYPKLIEERAALKSVDRSLQEEIQRIRQRAENDYEIAVQSEAGARSVYENARKDAEKLNDKTIEYTILSKEADDSESLYQDLLKRLKEAGILEGLHSSNLTMVEVARTPDKPSRPNVPVYLLLGLAVGAFLGLCAALLFEAIDNKVQGAEDIEALEIPLLGVLPHFRASDISQNPVPSEAQHSPFSEAVRALRSTLIISRSGKPPRIILVTSGSPQEGKSTVALNLAASFAQFKKKVLLVEADMRRPTMSRRLKLGTSGGLSTLLANSETEFQPVRLTDHEGLDLLPAGPPPPYPTELLGTSRIKELLEEWAAMYDVVIIDSPPILPVADTQILEPLADSTVLIARVGETSRVALQRSYGMIVQHAKSLETPNVGVILNSISLRSAAYYGYYGYYGGKSYDYGQAEGRSE